MYFDVILEDYKCFKLLSILNVHILGSKMACFNVTLPPKLKMLLFIKISFNIRDHTTIMSTNHPPAPSPPFLQKQTIDLLFKNNRICNHMTNFKTSPSFLLKGCHKCLVPYRKKFLKQVSEMIRDFIS